MFKGEDETKPLEAVKDWYAAQLQPSTQHKDLAQVELTSQSVNPSIPSFLCVESNFLLHIYFLFADLVCKTNISTRWKKHDRTKSTGLNHLALIPTIIPKILPRQRNIPGKEITYALILHPGLLSGWCLHFNLSWSIFIANL